MSISYRIRIKSQLDPYWTDWLGGLTLTNLENGEAELEGRVEGQEALHRILQKICDLNLCLISVEQMEDLREQNGGRMDSDRRKEYLTSRFIPSSRKHNHFTRKISKELHFLVTEPVDCSKPYHAKTCNQAHYLYFSRRAMDNNRL